MENDCTFFCAYTKCTHMYCARISDVPRYCGHKISNVTIGLDAILNEEDRMEKEI